MSAIPGNQFSLPHVGLSNYNGSRKETKTKQNEQSRVREDSPIGGAGSTVGRICGKGKF